jgi:hypothetical protein
VKATRRKLRTKVGSKGGRGSRRAVTQKLLGLDLMPRWRPEGGVAFILLLSAFQHDSCPPLYIDEKTVILNKYSSWAKIPAILQTFTHNEMARLGEKRFVRTTKERDTEKDRIETGDGNENRRGVQNRFYLNLLLVWLVNVDHIGR